MLLAADEHTMVKVLSTWLGDRLSQNETFLCESILKRNIPEGDGRNEDVYVGLPSIVLSIQSDARSLWAGANGRLRDCVLNIECRANEFAGSIEGEENPEGSHVQLARFVRAEIADNRPALLALGIDLTDLQGLTDGANVVSQRLTFTYSET